MTNKLTNPKESSATNHQQVERENQIGSAMVIAVLVLALLSIFVALAISRITTEAAITGNDTAQARTFYAAQGSLEMMSRNFNKLFDAQLNPTPTQISGVEDTKPSTAGFGNFTFAQTITPPAAGTSRAVTLPSGNPYAGLVAIQDSWTLNTTVTENSSDAQVRLTRTLENNRLPIFQFGVFSDKDLENHPGPAFYMNGRVHTNGNLYLKGGSGTWYDSAITAHGEIVKDVTRNNKNGWSDGNVFIKDASGVYQELKSSNTAMGGSVTGGPRTATPIIDATLDNSNPNVPGGNVNPNWATSKARFGGKLLDRVDKLELPIKALGKEAYREIIKRGKSSDGQVVANARYFNKSGLRISLSDSKKQLPGCADALGNAVTSLCGIRLDGASDGLGLDADANGSRGYQPKSMQDFATYKTTRMNGHRLYRGVNYPGGTATRQTWIKIETVSNDGASIVTKDVTEAVLSLGITQKAPVELSLQNPTADDRAIVKLQRFAIEGPAIKEGGVTTIGTGATARKAYTYSPLAPPSTNQFSTVEAVSVVAANANFTFPGEVLHARIRTTNISALVPFPIQIFDAHEGLYNETLDVNGWYGGAPNRTVPWIGVMSVVEIDAGNFKRLVDGQFNNKFPAGTLPGGASNLTIPTDNNGYIIYVSDRRGDKDDDGEFDMENVYVNKDNPNSDNSFQIEGEDVNADGILNVDYNWEASRYAAYGGWTVSTDPNKIVNPLSTDPNFGITQFATAPTDLAALFDHKYYRRSVRIVNGQQLPGDEDHGFTVATENGLYVQGNYNATGVTSVPAFGGVPTPSKNYCPNNNPASACVNKIGQVPASIAADGVTLLSNGWVDGRIFQDPFHRRGEITATETTYRMGVITGMTLEFLYVGAADGGNPNQGADHERMNGSIHEGMLKYIEFWGPHYYEFSTNKYLNYSGSLIHLFNSCNTNGTWKIGQGPNSYGSQPNDFGFHVFVPPAFNRTFEGSFLDPTRVPPGTPFIQYTRLTGFYQSND